MKISIETGKIIRYAEIALVSILLAIAMGTYRELKILQAVPVVLPVYWFNVTGETGKVTLLQARGTWVAADGPAEPLQTTVVECNHARMQCIESIAMISPEEKAYLESIQTAFDIERWTDTEVVTKPDIKPCGARSLVFDIVNRQASSIQIAEAPQPNCKSPLQGNRNLKLVTGPEVRSEALKKAKPY